MSITEEGVVGAPALREQLPVGSRVDEFQIIGLLGRGRASLVYRARDRARGRDVALKEYLPPAIAHRNARGLLMPAPSEAATFDAGRRAFLREAMELGRIQHPSLIRVQRAWQHGGTAYVAMPLVSGVTLDRACEPGCLAPTQAWLQSLLRPLLDLLTVLHRRHCTGLDLSARQLLVQDDGRPMLMGLGPRAFVAPGADAQARPAEPPARDLQALARTLLTAMACGLTTDSYDPAFVRALRAAADDASPDRPCDAQAWMAALDLPERRARVRLNRDFPQSRLAAHASYSRASTVETAVA